jgi:large subunit ribosomal protein L22
MEFRAQARFMRVSPQKARLVLNLIKGRKVEEALNILAFTKKRVAATVEKLLRSALENANYLIAEKDIDVDVDQLYVKNAIANDGPRMKRIRPAPMGRAFRYVRRIAHIELVLAERNRGTEGIANRLDGESAGAKPAKTARRAPAGKKKSVGKSTKKSTKKTKTAGAK